jgi:hypothetical protein
MLTLCQTFAALNKSNKIFSKGSKYSIYSCFLNLFHTDLILMLSASLLFDPAWTQDSLDTPMAEKFHSHPHELLVHPNSMFLCCWFHVSFLLLLSFYFYF